jgi:hypothetical protein
MITIQLTFDAAEKAIKTLQFFESLNHNKTDKDTLVSLTPLPTVEVHTRIRKKAETESKPVETESKPVETDWKNCIYKEEEQYTTHEDLKRFVQQEMLPVLTQGEVMAYMFNSWNKLTRLLDLPTADIPAFCSAAKLYIEKVKAEKQAETASTTEA